MGFAKKTSSNERASQKSQKNVTLVLAILMASTFSASFSQSMMNIALPHIADKFGVTLSIANWVVIGFTIVAATAITMAAALMSRIGLRKLFVFSAGCLAVGSLIGVLSFSFPVLIAARLVQAIATGMLYPVVTGVIAILVGTDRRGAVLALNSGIIGIGQAVGPLISGLLLTYFDLHIMFIPTLVLGIALVVAGVFVLYDVEDRSRTPIDLLSVALAFVGLATLMYGLGELTHDTLPAVIGLVIGAVVLAIFVIRQLKIKTPLLNLSPLRHSGFTIGVALVMFGMMGTAAMSLLLPLFYEGTTGDTPFEAGILISIPLVAYGLLAVVGGKIFDKKGIFPVVPFGYLLAVIGFLGIFFTAQHVLPYAVLAFSFGIYVGNSFIVAPSKTMALNLLSKDLYSYGAAINSIFVQIANSIGASLFVGILSADVLRETAHGMSRASAYGVGFSHALIISIVIAVAALILAFAYSWKMRKHKAHAQAANDPNRFNTHC